MKRRQYHMFNLLYFYLINSVLLFPAHKVCKVIQVPYGGLKEPSISKTFSGNYGITAFTMVSKEEIALLNSVERKVMVYSTITKQLTREFYVDAISRDFIFCNNVYYVLSDYRI
jgi:hypothetical protein